VATKITATAVTYGLTDCQPLVVEPPNRTMTDITRDFAWALTQVLGGVKEHDLTDQFGIPEDECAKVMSLLAQARAALEQPESEDLTDGKLEELADAHMFMDGSNGTMHLEHLDFARAAIAADRSLCARPAIKPVPVSERLPGPEDCDEEGRCWWGRPSEELCNSDWFLATCAEVDEFCDAWPPIVFLPHWALPVPTK
jgi:hypothetical protein